MVAVRFLGAGDAFGSGGRYQTCIAVQLADALLLVDCGASSLVAMKRLGVNPNEIDAVLVSHLHGDHFGGLPFLVLDGQFSRRERPLLVAGPPGVEARCRQALEVFFPGSSTVRRRFELRLLELAERVPTHVAGATVTAYAVPHPSGAPAYALRVAGDGRVVTYSGDGEWSDALLEAAADADLLIAEAYSFERPIKHHLSYAVLRANRARLTCRRLVLTHLGVDALAHLAEFDDEVAEDGLCLSV